MRRKTRARLEILFRLIAVAFVAATIVLPATPAKAQVPETIWDDDAPAMPINPNSDSPVGPVALDATLTDPGELDEEAIAFLNDRSQVDEEEVAGYLALMYRAGPCVAQIPVCNTPPATPVVPPPVAMPTQQQGPTSGVPVGSCFDSAAEYDQIKVWLNVNVKQKGTGATGEPCIFAHRGRPHLSEYRCYEGFTCVVDMPLPGGKSGVRVFFGKGQMVTGYAFDARRWRAYSDGTGARNPCLLAGKVKRYLRLQGLNPDVVAIPEDAGFRCQEPLPEVELTVGNDPRVPHVAEAEDCPSGREIDEMFGADMEKEIGFEKCLAFTRPTPNTLRVRCPERFICDLDFVHNGKRGNWMVVGSANWANEWYDVYGITGRLKKYSKAPCDHLQHWWDSYLKPRGKGIPQSVNHSCPAVRP